MEFALVAPLFIMLVMGMLDYGYFFYVDLICSNAAREAARAGVVADTLGDSLPLAESQGYVVLSNAGLGRGGINQPDVSAAIDGARAIRVVVSGPFTPLVGFVPLPDTLQAAATMRYEGDL